ncbi:MAG: ELM1/GtrOC1 family putative glycosyltransferase [Rhodospirillales bacterium]
MIGDKPGDNAQIELLADALQWPVEIRRLRFLPRYQTGKPRFRVSLSHIDKAASDPLVPPWPDLVLTIGRRPSMAALWVKEQSGGATRLVLIGRPRRFHDRFDLVLAPPQNRVPDRPNVVRLALPLLAADADAIRRDSDCWRERFSSLPRPLTAILVGGPTGRFIFDETVAGELVNSVLARTGSRGTLFVTTSRRTPPPVIRGLERSLPPEAVLYRWSEAASDNPYKALLGLADAFVVTGDSASMMVEVARLGRPLIIYPLPVRPSRVFALRRRLASRLQPPSGNPSQSRLTAAIGDWLYDRGLVLHSRDFDDLYRALTDRGLATLIEDSSTVPPSSPADELPQVAARIRSLVAVH